MTDTKSQPAVGIDLGTTFSAVAFLDAEGRPETIRNSEGDLTTPSAVFFDHQRPIVGMEAVEAGLLEPDRLAQFAKRDVGERFYEKTIRGKHLPAEVIQALVLRKLKADAELKLGQIHEAVITVPAFFNEPCRKATRDAGRLAGLKVLDIINEPTAAAITYGVEQGFLKTDGTNDQRETVLVYDLGGGTFDVTVMEIERGNFNTIATAGDVYLGGIDWDNRIVDLIAEAFKKEHGIDPREDPQAEQELLRKANQTKHALTQRESVTVAFANDGRRMRTEITAKAFAERCVDLVERTLMTVHLVLDDAGIEWPDLTRLILVGGSTRMPMIRDELQQLSGMELDRSLSPDEAVSHGAALYAGMLLAGKNDRSGISVSNVNSHDLGVLAVDPKSNRPRRKIMIPRNSKLPASKMVRFRTHQDNQSNVKIQVVEGGDKRGINATRIGKCVVADLPEGIPKGTSVDVRFDYTSDGRLTVHASLPQIDRKITMTLDRASGLSSEQIRSWGKVLDDGFSDAALAGLPDPETDAETESPDLAVGELPGEISAEVSTDNQSPEGEDSAQPLFGNDQSASEKEPGDAGFPKIDVSTGGSSTGKKSTKPSAAAILNVSVAPQISTTQAAKTSAAKTSSKTQAATTKATAETNAPEQRTPDVKPQITAERSGANTAAPKHTKPSIQIEVPDQPERQPTLTAADAESISQTLGQPADVVREKPALELDPKDERSAAKADADDLELLAALGNQPEKVNKESSEIPFIVTDRSSDAKLKERKEVADEGGTKKKAGGLFGRKKK